MPVRSFIASLLSLAFVASAAQADLILFDFQGKFRAPESPFVGGQFHFQALVPQGAPTLFEALATRDTYKFIGTANALVLSGTPSSDGLYHTTDPSVLFTENDEFPGSGNFDNIVYQGHFNLAIGALEFNVIGFFPNQAIFANIATSIPTFLTTDALVTVGSHSIDGGTLYNTSDVVISATLVPNDTKIVPEASSIVMIGLGAGGCLVAGIARRRSSK